MITASSITRYRRCASAAVLPRAENHSEWADGGHDEHEELARMVASKTLPDELAKFVTDDARPEVAFAYDVATGAGRMIGQNLGRAYGQRGPFEIVGSADVVGIEGDAVVIVDWKTGFQDVEPAATNEQLHFYALAACRALGKDTAIVRIVYTKTGRCDEHVMDWEDLAGVAQQLVDVHRSVAERQAMKARGEILSTVEGSWCKHCASKSVCPSKVGLLVQIAEKGLAVIGDSVMTHDRAVAAYRQVAAVEQLVKDARKRLETYVDETGPLDLGDGKLYGRYERKGNEALDGEIAVQAIREVVGESAKEFEAIAIERKTTKAAITRAAEATSVKAAQLTTKVIARIRDLGGSSSKPTRPIGEFVLGKNDPAPRQDVDLDRVNALLESA